MVSDTSLQHGDSSGPNFPSCFVSSCFACHPLELQVHALFEIGLAVPCLKTLARVDFWPLMSVPRPQQLNQARFLKWSRHCSAPPFLLKALVQMSLLGDFPVPPRLGRTPPSSPDNVLQERPPGQVCGCLRSSSLEAELETQFLCEWLRAGQRTN